MTHHAYLSLGSNLGDRVANLQSSIRLLGKLGEVTRISSFYDTEPVEVREQPWFLNCVVEVGTSLSARELLVEIQKIEAKLGRGRDIHKGPRTLDIDIVLFDSETINEDDLQIPHPGMHQRAFVLAPLAEICPQVKHPALGKTAEELLGELPADAGQVRRLAPK